MRLPFDLDDLVAFRALADLGSFRRAAETVHLSQPAFSRRIDKLERALGVALVQRTTRRVALTAAGREFERKMRVLLDDLDNMLLAIRGDPATRGERVTLGCVPSVVPWLVAEVLRRYRLSHPRVQVVVLDTKAHEVRQAVAQGDADFGLSFLDEQDGDLEFSPLYDEAFVLACRADHALAARESVAWAELDAHAFIALARTSGNRLVLDRALAGMALRPRVAYEVQTGSAALALVEAGLGVAAMPATAIEPPHRAGAPAASAVVGVALGQPEVRRTMGLLRRRGRALSASAAQLYLLFQHCGLAPAPRPLAHGQPAGGLTG
jgi:DNA-binding transcriptional LysR family regulator